MRGSWRTGGIILRGSGRAAAAAGGAATTVGGVGFAATGCWGGVAERAGNWLLRAASSCSCFLARIAFSASPGLEMWDRSTFGCKPCGERDWALARLDAPLR